MHLPVKFHIWTAGVLAMRKWNPGEDGARRLDDSAEIWSDLIS